MRPSSKEISETCSGRAAESSIFHFLCFFFDAGRAGFPSLFKRTIQNLPRVWLEPVSRATWLIMGVMDRTFGAWLKMAFWIRIQTNDINIHLITVHKFKISSTEQSMGNANDHIPAKN